MKRIRLTRITNLLMVGVITNCNLAEGGETQIPSKSKERIEAIKEDNPVMHRILFRPTDKGSKVELSQVRESVRNYATKWTREIVRGQWLPDNLESAMGAAKDVRFWERKRLSNGLISDGFVMDVIFFDYDIAGHSIHVQENGVGLSVRLNFPQEVDASKDPATKVRQWLSVFFNIPSDVLSVGDLEIEVKGTVIHARRKGGLPPAPQNVGDEDKRQWWDGFNAWTDGQFLYASFPEIRPGPYRPSSKFGPPDRF